MCRRIIWLSLHKRIAAQQGGNFLLQVLNPHLFQVLQRVPAALVVQPDAAEHRRGDVGHQKQHAGDNQTFWMELRLFSSGTPSWAGISI